MANQISLDIEPADVIRLIEQYLKENNLLKTLKTLQEETCVSLNTVDSIETFVNDINSGHWDVVLKIVKSLKLPDHKLVDLYEQIAIELIELRETRAAKWLIHKTEPMMKLKSINPDRYLQLQNLIGRSYFDPKEAYRDGSSRERQRNLIAQSLKKEVLVVPPQRLLNLIGDALKWQRHEGLLPSSTSIDIFTGKAHMVHAEEEIFPTTLHKHCVKPIMTGDMDEDQIFVCCADFTPDGQYIVIGYSTGLIEMRNSTSGRLANDLKYQLYKSYIVTPSKSAALSLCFGINDLLAVGDKAGDISIWKLETGQLVQLFQSAHTKSVNCLLFHKNGREILSGGHDATIKLHGMRSNKTLRDFRGHKSFVNSIASSKDDDFILSASSDSTIKVWNVKTALVIREFKCPAKSHTVLLMPNTKDEIFLIGNRTKLVQFIDLEGVVKYEIDGNDNESCDKDGNDVKLKRETSNFYSICSSPKGNYVYAVDSNSIYCFNHSTKKLDKKLIVHDEKSNDLIGVKHHPFLNLLVTYDTHGNLKLWKP